MASRPRRNRVLIAGGGIAALEGLLAIRDLTDGEAEITMLAPEREFTYRPLLVLEPFSADLAPRRDLASLLADLGGSFVEDRLRRLDADAGVAVTEGGTELEFDQALIALGARMRPPFEAAHTLWIEPSPTPIESILDRAAEAGGLDLVVPPRVTWSLPLYEFALMAERRLREREAAVPIRILTPEQSPLAIFGPVASSEVAELLDARGIAVLPSTWISEDEGGSLQAAGEGSHELTGYAVALPALEGVPLEGLPSDADGFIPVDDHARVRGCDHVYAAGDGTDFPVKQGGIATQQADAAAEQIALAMGFDFEPQEQRPVLRGKLLTGGESLSIRTPLTGGEGEGVVSSDYLWWPPHKVSGRYLAPWLADESVHIDLDPPTRSIDVEARAVPRGDGRTPA